MAQPYRLNKPGGIKIEATGEIIYPGDPAWADYEEWLAEQPGSATPGGAPPAGTGLLPYEEPPQTLAQLRAEALARLDGVVSMRRSGGSLVAFGHTFNVHWGFVLAVLVHRAAFPPVPAGFTLPDAAHNQVAINNAQLNTLVDAMSARLIAMNANYAALVTAINASAAPLTINLEAGWPP